MALFQLTKDTMDPIDTATFADLGYKEREDLQRLLRERIKIIVPDGYVIAEEFCDWDASARRIDLLVIDREANLVVVELKRTEDGGHSELQALRYAAMISKITFEQVVDAHRHFLLRLGIDGDPEQRILDFLDWPNPDEDRFGQDIRIVLASAEFSKELTTSVIWLNEQGLDIRCVRMKPYKKDESIILDVEQILPLPESQEYQVQVRQKASFERSARRGQSDRQQRFQSFWQGLLEKANTRTSLHANISPAKDTWLGASRYGLGMYYVLAKGRERVELYISRSLKEENKHIFDELYDKRSEISQSLEHPLVWERLDEKLASRIYFPLVSEGNFYDESTWDLLQDDLIDSMIAFESAIGPHVQKYREGEKIERTPRA